MLRKLKESEYNLGIVDDYRDPASTLEFDSGKEMLKDPTFTQRIIKMYSNAPEVSAAAIAKPGFILGKSRTVDPALQQSAITFFDIYRGDMTHSVNKLGASLPSARVEHRTHLRKPVVFIDLPEEIAMIPGQEEAAMQVYKAFEMQSWMWSPEFDTAADAFNAYMKEEFTPSLEAGVKQLETKGRTPSEEDRLEKTRKFLSKADEIEKDDGKTFLTRTVQENLDILSR